VVVRRLQQNELKPALWRDLAIPHPNTPVTTRKPIADPRQLVESRFYHSAPQPTIA
jgi:hypothetical protein